MSPTTPHDKMVARDTAQYSGLTVREASLIIMVDAGIGRLLVASLHQGIADVAPIRLPFYENWLTPPGLRDARFGLAPLHAVLSFLRLEGPVAYDQIMRRAGVYTADWGFAELWSIQRTIVRGLPVGLRTRAALYLSRRLVQKTFRGSRTNARLRKGSGTIDLRGSIFCDPARNDAVADVCLLFVGRRAVSRPLRNRRQRRRVAVQGVGRGGVRDDDHSPRAAGRATGG